MYLHKIQMVLELQFLHVDETYTFDKEKTAQGCLWHN